MHNFLAVASALVAIAATLPYILDTLQNKTRPNIVTWFTWTLLNLITTLAVLSGHAVQTAIFVGATGVCTATITLLSLRNGIKKYTFFDGLCQILAILSVIAWQLTRNPEWAVMCTIAASFIGSLPTLRHAWKAPYEETWKAFAIDAFSAALVCLSVQDFNFLSLALPAYILLDDALISAVIFYRRQSS